MRRIDAGSDKRAKREASLNSADIEADVLIVGGGFIGLALACGLAGSGIAPAVVESGDPRSALAASFDGRASAIALTSRRLLQAIDVWPKLSGEAAPMQYRGYPGT